jgi:DNA polymerase-3 subunit delta'
VSFQDIRGQETALTFLRRVVEHDRLPSAFLFLGAHHVGKRMAALTLAKAINCESPPKGAVDSCDHCPSCRKVDAGVHPDVITVEPDGQFIKIDQVRDVGEQLGLNPLLAKRRVIVMAEAERMNPQSANAFLKTLEEPPADTLIVMTATDTAHLLPTIISRCVPVRFAPLTEAVLRELLAEAGGDLKPDATDFAVRFSQGRLRPEFRDKFAAWLAVRDELVSAFQHPEGALGLGLGDKFAKWSTGGEWVFVLEWLESWFRDVALAGSATDPARLVNQDRQAEVQAFAARVVPETAARCQQAVLSTRDAVLFNANKPLALEALWLRLQQQG